MTEKAIIILLVAIISLVFAAFTCYNGAYDYTMAIIGMGASYIIFLYFT